MIKHLLPRAAAALLFVVSAIPAGAAEQLSLQQAVGLALKNNPTIAAGQLSATAAGHAARGAKALTNPEASIAPSVVGTAGADSAILFVQPLEINGSRRVRGQIAAHEATASSFDANATQRDVVLRVKQTYWDVARAQELVRLNQDNIHYLETLNKASQKQLEVGAVPGTQLIKTEVELARARQELDQAQLELLQSRSGLNALLNRPKDIEFAATDALTFSEMILDPNALQASACTQRPEVASAQAQLGAVQGQIKAARLRTVPDLSIEARRGTLEAESDGGVAIGLTLPFLDWGSAKGERRRAQSAAQSQGKRLEAVRNQVALEVEQSVQQVQTSAKIVKEFQQGILAKSEQLAAKAQEGYARGATGYLDVLEAQRTLRTVRTTYYSALSDYLKAQAQLEWATGGQQSR
ncbi:MAG: TolC family protein [Armatimonadetes bacterium]|nr:TolC family protein [Armatimonadota bacterium]